MDKLINQEMFFLLAGPCVIEGEEMALNIAEHVKKVTDRLGIPYVFKGSFKKANRSRLDSFTGIGDEKALKILAKVKAEFGIPVVTDIHTERDAEMAAEYVDVLQIPAFLCRQTDLLVAAAKAVQFPDQHNVKQLLVAVFYHLLELWTVVRLGRDGTVNIVLDDGDAILFRIGRALPDLAFDRFFTLVVEGLRRLQNDLPRAGGFSFCKNALCT